MNLFTHLKEIGLYRTIVYYIRKELGINKMQEELSSLYYFLNNFTDITSLPPTKDPDLRILQKCDTLLLGIFDKLCNKYGLTYWMDWGTLLGAIRHKGFIPWDDDTDLAMLRSDYNKVIPLMKEELCQYGIDIEYVNNETLSRIGVSYKHKQTGIWIDVTPDDEFISSKKITEVRQMLYPILKKYRKVYKNNKEKVNEEEIWEMKKKLIFDKQDEGVKYLFTGQEFPQDVLVMEASDLLPTIRVPFDGITLSAPVQFHKYLNYLYNDSFMNYPHSGLEHHGGEGKKRPALKYWAKQNGINMEEVYNHLCHVYEKLE